MRLARYGTPLSGHSGFTRGSLLAFAGWLVLAFASCADAGAPDGFVTDGGATAFDGSPVSPPNDREDPDFDAGACFDGLDNDADGTLDCAEAECGVRAECCVGSVECCSGATRLSTLTEECEDGPASACDSLEGLTLFGAPTIERTGLVPQGGAGHGGVVMHPSVDPRAGNLRVQARIEAPTTPCAECVDLAGIALVEAAPAPGARAVVWLGVVAVSSRGEAQVVASDEVVATFSLMAAAEYEIELRADGVATVSVGSESVALTELELPPSIQVIAYGRTQNRGAGVDAARLRGGEVFFEACDMPAALERDPTPRLPTVASGFTPRALGRATALMVEDRLLTVFADDGDLYQAMETRSGDLAGPADRNDRAVVPPEGIDDLFDPALVVEDGAVTLYFAGEDVSGVRRIFRSRREGDTFAAPEDVLAVDGGSVDGPTVFKSPAGPWRMIARVRRGAQTSLEQFEAIGGDTGAWRPLSVVRAPAAADLFAFDRDDVAQPAVVRSADGLYRLYYAGQRGTGWSIGLLVSQDGDAWRPLGAVLTPDGEGFDALQVRGPAPVLRTDRANALHLYYTASDGVSSAIGLAGPAGTLGE